MGRTAHRAPVALPGRSPRHQSPGGGAARALAAMRGVVSLGHATCSWPSPTTVLSRSRSGWQSSAEAPSASICAWKSMYSSPFSLSDTMGTATAAGDSRAYCSVLLRVSTISVIAPRRRQAVACSTPPAHRLATEASTISVARASDTWKASQLSERASVLSTVSCPVSIRSSISRVNIFSSRGVGSCRSSSRSTSNCSAAATHLRISAGLRLEPSNMDSISVATRFTFISRTSSSHRSCAKPSVSRIESRNWFSDGPMSPPSCSARPRYRR
mmetsp:Transcript_6208/g.20388  ORF Transcript_6208/g.20388 Transcript_6208/m.20388 type:complete len:271 (+) Transcript_6208:615-1427(+)